MVVTLLAALGIQSFSGLFSNDEIFNVGPLYGYVEKDASLKLTSLHRHLFYWISAAVGMHILAVIAHHLFGQGHLLRAMVTGCKPQDLVREPDGIASSRCWLALALIIAIAGVLTWIVTHAEMPMSSSEMTFFRIA